MARLLIPLAPLLLAVACVKPTPSIDVRDAWARATAPGQSSGAVYATLVNSGPDDQLTSVATDRAAMAMIHTNETVDGVARMRMTGDVAIPDGATVNLAPGGTHVMLEGLTAPLVAGQKFSLELRFAGAGTRRVAVRVVAPGSR